MKHEEIQGVRTRLGEAVRQAREIQRKGWNGLLFIFENGSGELVVSSELSVKLGEHWITVMPKGQLLYYPGQDSIFDPLLARKILDAVRSNSGPTF